MGATRASETVSKPFAHPARSEEACGLPEARGTASPQDGGLTDVLDDAASDVVTAAYLVGDADTRRFVGDWLADLGEALGELVALAYVDGARLGDTTADGYDAAVAGGAEERRAAVADGFAGFADQFRGEAALLVSAAADVADLGALMDAICLPDPVRHLFTANDEEGS